jgi:hypothetical protein
MQVDENWDRFIQRAFSRAPNWRDPGQERGVLFEVGCQRKPE